MSNNEQDYQNAVYGDAIDKAKWLNNNRPQSPVTQTTNNWAERYEHNRRNSLSPEDTGKRWER